MSMHRRLLTSIALIIPLTTLLMVAACRPSSLNPPPDDDQLPTLAQLPTITTTFTPSPTRATATPTAPATASATITETTTATASRTPLPATATRQPTNANTPTPLPSAFRFGTSVEGRELLAYRYGVGAHIIMLVGGIHAGFEANTVTLIEELRAHYARVPGDIQADVQIVLIPSLNPDGIPYGRQLRGRFNANEVDLNRNWGCDWSEDAVFRDMNVDAGAMPFSEPESEALAALIMEIKPSVVLFYHGAANGVFAGRCGGEYSDVLAEVYGAASGYPYGAAFGGYRITGSAPAWVNSLGIPSADIELATADGTEFMRNLRAINAVQTWLRNTPAISQRLRQG